MKLGDLLLKEGLVTQAELDEALKYQVIFGGKLGTNLIEMGVVDEDDISRALSRKLGVPPAGGAQMEKIPADVISLLPREMAEKYQVIPLGLEGRRLTVAMVNPSDLKTLDELGFRTGYIIRPMIAAETRLIHALETYYDVRRELRYIHGPKKIEVGRKRKSTPSSQQATATPKPVPPPAEPTEEEPELIEIPGLSDQPPPPPEEPEELEEEILDLDEAEEIEIVEESPVDEQPREEEEQANVEPVSEELLPVRLVEARDRDEIFDAIIGNLAQDYPRCALFLVRGEMAMGWRCVRERQLVAGFDQLQVPLDEPSVLKTVVDSRSYSLGPLPRTPFNSMILQEMGGQVPETALLVPLVMMGRVVGILFVDGAGIDLGERLFSLQKLTARAAMAFEIMVLKNKIVML